jgi:hypothetical protein
VPSPLVRAITVVSVALACRGHDKASVPASDTKRAADAADAAGCGFVRVAGHPDGEQLIRDFVERDARGEFLRTSAWFSGAVNCPDHEPAPDDAEQITSYRVQMVSRSPDTVRARVTYRGVGVVNMKGEEGFGTLGGGEFTAVRTPFGWRIASPVPRRHVRLPYSSPDSMRGRRH